MSQPTVTSSPGGSRAVGYTAVAMELRDRAVPLRAAGTPPTGASPETDLGTGIAAGPADWVRKALAAVESRADCADHQLLTLLALYFDGGELLPDEYRQAIRRAALGFRYFYDEPGTDSMCHWSESHQACFAVCEVLAGELFGDEVFDNDGRTGKHKARRARARLEEWLGLRFRHGFSEWLSGTYYAITVAALTLLVEHCQDDDLVLRATIVLDLVMLDLAVHRFEGHFVGSAGRVHALFKAHPERSEVERVVASAFGRTRPAFDPADPTSIFLVRRRYRVPQVVREISADGQEMLATSSHGLMLAEVDAEVAREAGPGIEEQRDARVRLLWSMEAFTTPEGIGPSIEAIGRHKMESNSFLAPLVQLRHVRPSRALRTAVRALNPITQGAALQRADVQTYRTPHYLLSSAQRHQPGSFGDQENIWEAALPGGIHVFSTHPGATMLGTSARPATPSGWEGNGIRPDVAQLRNVLLALHDVRGRSGYLEGRRHELSHLYFPAALFDETRLGRQSVAGRRGDSYFGALALRPIEMINESEIVQRGAVTGWAVLLADRSEFGSLGRFVEHLKSCRLDYFRGTLQWTTPAHQYDLTWRGAFRVDQHVVETDYAKLRSPWTSIARKPSVVEVQGRTGTLVLDWKMGERSQGPGVPNRR